MTKFKIEFQPATTVQIFCPKLHQRQQDSHHSEAVFRTDLPLLYWAQLAEHPNFLNMIQCFWVYCMGEERTH